MNKTINFLFGTAGTAGTMEAIEVFPAGPDEINSLVLVVVKALVSILGGVLTTKVMELLKKKGQKVLHQGSGKSNVELTKNN